MFTIGLIKLVFKYKTVYRWALVGMSTFLIDYFIFLKLYERTSMVVFANFFSGVISISFNYYMHYFWSFKSNVDHSRTGVKYIINLITFWSVSTVLLKLLIEWGLEPKFAKFIPILVIAPISFFSLKNFVFKKNNNKHLPK